MLEFKLKMNDFQKIIDKGFMDFEVSNFIDEQGNEYPPNIYKIISKIEIEKLKPVVAEKFSEIYEQNCKCFFNVDVLKAQEYYIATVKKVYFVYDEGIVRVSINNVKKYTKNQYDQIQRNIYYKDEKNKINLKIFIISPDNLIHINESLLIKLKYSEDMINYLHKGRIRLKSKLSNEIYSYKIKSYKISNDQKVIEVSLLKPNRLVGKDWQYKKNGGVINKNNVYKSSVFARDILVVKISEITDELKLVIKNQKRTGFLNQTIKEGNIKFLFGSSGITKRVESISIESHDDYTEYDIKFYKVNSSENTLKSYLKQNKVAQMVDYDEINIGTIVSFYKFKNNKSAKNNQDVKKENKNKLDIVDELQVIDSNNNHVTKKHRIIDCKFYIRFRDSKYDSSNILVDYNGHYCIECKKYFDFKYSFIEQMKKQEMAIQKIETKLIDDNGKNINLDKLKFELYKKESILHTYGYRVGYTGLIKSQRQSIIDNILKKEILTISEIKDILNRNISQFQNNKRYDKSVEHWTEDLKYVIKKYY